MTAVLFAIGKIVIGLYYRAAAVLLLPMGQRDRSWYCSAWVIITRRRSCFFGAEFTQVYTARHGQPPATRSRRAPAERRDGGCIKAFRTRRRLLSHKKRHKKHKSFVPFCGYFILSRTRITVTSRVPSVPGRYPV